MRRWGRRRVDEEALALQARALDRLKRSDEANEVWLELALQQPRSAAAREAAGPLLAWADARLGRQDFEPARRIYEVVRGTGVSSEGLYLNLTLALWRLDRRDDALATLRSGVAAHPRSAELHYRLGRMLEGRGQRPEAAAAFRRALELAPDRKDAADGLRRAGS